jgi:hypothetical protein
MQTGRRCWIDIGTEPVFEAWVKDISDAGATIVVEDRAALLPKLTVYFDEHRYVGRTATVEKRDGHSYRVIFTGKAPRAAVTSGPR